MSVLMLMVACIGGDSGSDTGTKGSSTSSSTTDDGGGKVTVSIKSPSDGDVFDYGESVDFMVKSSDGSKIKTAEWTIGDISQKGTEVTIDNLPAGDLHVKVSATVGSKTLTDAIDITVNDPEPIAYNGSINMNLHLNYDGNKYDDTCPGSVSFTYDGKTLTGSGTCTDDLLSSEFPFTLDGTNKGGKISGNLILDADGTKYSTPYEATGKYGSKIDATYDYTHKDGNNTLRIEGTWTASP